MNNKPARSDGQFILIVDDEPTARTLLRLILVRAGFNVVEATNGFEALDRLEETAVDLVLLDVMMPGMSGIEVCEKIRADEKTAVVPILLLSAKTDALSIRRGLSAGANKYLTKPISPDILLDLWYKALNVLDNKNGRSLPLSYPHSAKLTSL